VLRRVRVRIDGGGGVQDTPEVSTRCSTVRAQEAVVADFDEALGSHRLEAAAEERFGGKRQVLPRAACAVLDSECYRPIFKLFRAVVGEGNPTDGGGEVGDDRRAGAGWFTVDPPVMLPDLGRPVLEQPGFGQRRLELAAEDFGEGADGNQPIRLAGGEPCRAV
jgi:hypothetical protein